MLSFALRSFVQLQRQVACSASSFGSSKSEDFVKDTTEMTNVMSATLFLVLVLAVYSGSAIRCWDCNSKFDPRCAHDHFDNHTLETVDCDQESLPHMPDVKAQYCRKVIQYVEGKQRTVRGCGWLHDRRADEYGGCYSRTGTKDVMVTFCSCSMDGCNPAAPQVTPLSTVGMAALVLTSVGALI